MTSWREKLSPSGLFHPQTACPSFAAGSATKKLVELEKEFVRDCQVMEQCEAAQCSGVAELYWLGRCQSAERLLWRESIVLLRAEALRRAATDLAGQFRRFVPKRWRNALCSENRSEAEFASSIAARADQSSFMLGELAHIEAQQDLLEEEIAQGDLAAANAEAAVSLLQLEEAVLQGRHPNLCSASALTCDPAWPQAIDVLLQECVRLENELAELSSDAITIEAYVSEIERIASMNDQSMQIQSMLTRCYSIANRHFDHLGGKIVPDQIT
jgi:hypothetical protein